ncbi:hypothetical protein D7X30_38550 [Corallococcus sp. AB011P]|uniref:SitA5 family polymorphic toxin n=1 Tax=Corallococcus sp. AB011P TaxID=2316735 RepID=UPI000EA33557|nr:hypothetical protein [Corallococcus sp. AB011P]RKG49833.1 hypothetical protein D7X30_38550 [Corallococcus sp. AB011P]
MATRLGVTLLLLVLLNACATPRVIRLDTGQGAPLEFRPSSSSNPPVKMDTEAFEEALAQLVLDVPLTLRAPQQILLVRASHPGTRDDSRWQRLMRKSFGGLCDPGQRRDHCLSLLDDGIGLGEWDKLGVALGLSLEPLKESIARAVEKTLAPQLFYTVIATGLITWAVLAANPEPVFTKAAAIVSAVLLIYLGVETFLEVVDASRELKRATDRATTWIELDQAGQRFANRVGPEVARVFVLAVTVVVSQGMTGGAAWLASRLSMLPGYMEAAAAGASRLGINLANVGQVSAVAVEGSTVVISLPSTAVAMVAQGSRGTAAGSSPAGVRSWGSFSGLKSAMGSAGPGKNWHHIVEQTPGNVARFGPHSLHNTENVISLEEGLHTQVSAFYSRRNLRVTGSRDLTVRQWLRTQSYEAQRAFGLQTIANIRNGVW